MNKSNENLNKKISARTLVRKQIENKDFHVSEEDMMNLDTSVEFALYTTGKSSKNADPYSLGNDPNRYGISGN